MGTDRGLGITRDVAARSDRLNRCCTESAPIKPWGRCTGRLAELAVSL
jgi:hypothetical protein